MMRTAAYLLACIYSFIATSAAVLVGIISISFLTIIGSIPLYALIERLGFVAIVIISAVIAIIIMIHDLTLSSDVNPGLLELANSLNPYALICRRLANVMGIEEEFRIYISPRLPLAAYVFKERGCRCYGLVIGLLIAKFPLEEVTAIIAHEIAHLKRGDVCLGSLITLPHRVTGKFLRVTKKAIKILAKSVIGWPLLPFACIAYLVLFIVHAPTTLISRVVNRHMELGADQLAAKYIDPKDLAKALARYEEIFKELVITLSLGDISLVESLDPRAIHVDLSKYLKARLSFWDKLYYAFMSTHPPTSVRIKKLLELSPIISS